MQTKISVHSTMNESDYRKVSYFNAFVRKYSTLILMGVVFIIGVLGLIFHEVFMTVPFSIIFLIYPFILLGLIELRTRKTIAKRMQSSRKQTIDISESGIHCVREDNTSDYDWSSITGFYETPNYFLIYTSSKILSVPKRDMTDEQCQELRNLVVNTLPHNRRRVK
ncbi:MAG: YcxB family protein [Massiliimalia sp.]|jgi:hypothetical protein